MRLSKQLILAAVGATFLIIFQAIVVLKGSASEMAAWMLASSTGIFVLLAYAGSRVRFMLRHINRARRVLERVSSGDTESTRDLDVGKAVNCSSAKGCSTKSCPSYGKVDSCWVSSGSMAGIRHCPRALKGEDCQTCELYGATNEIQELNGTIQAMSNYLAERFETLVSLASGDLTAEVLITSEHDSMGRAINQMVVNLHDLIGNTKQTADRVRAGSHEISSSSCTLAQGATETAASLEEITSSLTEVNSQTDINADNANQANELATAAKQAAEKGNGQMHDLEVAINNIQEGSQEIAKIMKVIDDIAFQTNLL
ncbi:MAG: methyl-accepting chemotaxis protein, partial [bacterium]